MGTKRSRMAVAVVLGLLSPGCAVDGNGARFGDDGGGSSGAAGGPALAGAGGTQMGTGGASAAGAIGSTFSRDDHAMCENWPDCPTNIIAPWAWSGSVESTTCQMAAGVVVRCGACIDRNTCAPFVGRCRARHWDPFTGAMVGGVSRWSAETCNAWLSMPTLAQTPRGWSICTGDESVGDAAATVCKD